MSYKVGILLQIITIFAANACNVRKLQEGFVCVCNSSYCDQVPKIQTLEFGQYQLYFTGKSSPGFNTHVGRFSSREKKYRNVIKINTQKRYQKIIGFGGAFTDATGINLKSLPNAVQKNLLESYFGEDGIEYSLCRVPIGGTDFSPRPYSYDDYPNDTKLENFKLQEEDFLYKIPFIAEAKSLRGNKNFKLFASAWTAPPWMKNRYIYSGYSLLKEEYYQLWADYILKFFDQYHQNNISFWGMTTGNEPIDGFISYSSSKINAMGWVPLQQMKWIKQNLGPSIRKSPYKDLKIMIHDDARITIPYVIPLMFSDQETLNYIDGVATHWYWDDRVPSDILDFTKTDQKEVFRLSTESCFFKTDISLGSWDRAAVYIGSIMEYLENDFGGWLDWNMALNLTGGPTYIDYTADSPVLVNASSQEFYKQPMFYAMGHFSKFIVPDSLRLDVSYALEENSRVKSVAFLRPDNKIAAVIINNDVNKSVIQLQSDGLRSDLIELDAKSIYTILYPIETISKSGNQ